jgi:hypothetical protein
MHGTYYEADCLDRHALGRDVTDFTEYIFNAAPKDLEERGSPENSANVLFDNLVRDPIGTVRDVYQQLKWDFTPEYKLILQEHVAADTLKREAKKCESKREGKSGHGMYHHSSDRFGVDQSIFAQDTFKEYIDKYGLQDNKL